MEKTNNAENWPWIRVWDTWSCCTHLTESFLKGGAWDLILEKKIVFNRWILHFEQNRVLNWHL